MSTMEQFKEDYPYAKFNKFHVGADGHGIFTSSAGKLGMVSITDPTFLNSRYSNDLLYGNMGAVLMRKLYKSNYDKGMKNHESLINKAREEFRKLRNVDLLNFKVYVSKVDHFPSKFPKIISKLLPWNTRFDKKIPYFHALCGAYVATYLWGIYGAVKVHV